MSSFHGLRCLTFHTYYVILVIDRNGQHNIGGINMSKGTVKWFNNQKGYGFISDEEGNDIFVHYSGLNMEGYKSLHENDAVEFEIIEGAKGPQAVNVTKL